MIRTEPGDLMGLNGDGESGAKEGRRTRESARHIGVVASSLDLLECFVDHGPLSVGEMAAITGINRSRIMRLAGTLESRGYLVYDFEIRRYRLGARLLTLGKRFEEGLDLINLARPLLNQLARSTGETASLYGIDGLARVVLALEHGHHEVRHALAVGDRKVLFAGASGKVLLAYSHPSLVAKVQLQADRNKPAPSDRAVGLNLKDKLEQIRKHGYAESYGERLADAAAIAAPVFDGHNRIVGALGISGAINRFTTPFRDASLLLVVSLTEALSRLIGWRGSVAGTAVTARVERPRINSLEEAER